MGNIDKQLLDAEKKFFAKKDYERAYECLYYLWENSGREIYDYLFEFRLSLTDYVKRNGLVIPNSMDILKKSYKLSAKDIFDDFCIFTEWNRSPESKFYLPRRKGLLPVVKQLQRLEDDELDLLCISMPPGTGKTGIAIFYLCWLSGKYPDLGNLGGSHNAAFLRGLYDECLREMHPQGEYLWGELFERPVARTNAQDMKIDIQREHRFSTIQLSSIGSGNAGKVRAMKLLYLDDLIEGIEEALSEERLAKKWQLYTTDYRQRKQGNCKELHIATRWSVRDIIGRLQELYGDDPRAEFLSMPALNDEGESNFDYGGDIGFSTEFYEDIKMSMDEMSWKALYMNQPIEREGQLYNRDELRRFYELPSDEPDAIIGVCDTAEGGGDSLVLPIGYVYGSDHYIFDVVDSDALPEVTDELCVTALVKNSVKMCQFESNAAGGRTADKVSDRVKEECMKLGKRPTNITKKRTTQNKETKIIVNSPWVKEHCLFLDDKKIIRGSMYDKFLNKLCSYSVSGKNKHDDEVDAVAQYALFAENLSQSAITVKRRPF